MKSCKDCLSQDVCKILDVAQDHIEPIADKMMPWNAPPTTTQKRAALTESLYVAMAENCEHYRAGGAFQGGEGKCA